MSDWKDRLKTEYEELNSKVIRLDDYLERNYEGNESSADFMLLQFQYRTMCDYADILEERIRRFEDE